MDYNLSKLYQKVYSSEKTAAKKTISQLYKEDVQVTFQPEGENPTTYKLPDPYARNLMKKIKVETSTGVDEPINKIFKNGGWGAKQDAPKTIFKNIVIGTDYEQSADLINYLADNKSKLLTLKDIAIGGVVNFIEAIVNKLPDNFKTEGLEDFIKQVHLNVVPAAATNVGLGEATFSFFGTAAKGTSGDLQWSGKEIEIKTNGSSNAGAVLGGDGFMNKITSRVQYTADYIPLKSSQLQLLLTSLNKVEDEFSRNGANTDKLFSDFKSQFKDSNLFSANKKLGNIISSINVKDFFTKPITSDFTFMSKPKSGAQTLYTSIVSRIKGDIAKANTKITNFPSQVSSLLPTGSDKERYAEVFSNLRTYENIGIDLKPQLLKFFEKYDPNSFDPKVNYKKFTNLVGTIAIIGYKNHLGFDYITAGNDKKFTIAFINCETPSIESIYNQVANIPGIEFNVDIDVYEGGAFRSQTVFAKSPRIILN